MEISFRYHKLEKVRETGLFPNMNSEERKIAWLKTGLARSFTERFYFLTALMKIHFVVINGRYHKQYF
jgi:hypothetical protein